MRKEGRRKLHWGIPACWRILYYYEGKTGEHDEKHNKSPGTAAGPGLDFGLVVTGFADATSGTSPDTKGNITIDNAVKDQTYKIYRILELESFDETAKAYSYKVAIKWKGFIDSEGKQYFPFKITEMIILRMAM